MKKIGLSLLVFVLLFSALPAFAAEQEVKVQADGVEVVFPDAQPVVQDGIVMLPVYFVLEQLGATVLWEEAAREVHITNGEDQIVFKPGENVGTVNGVEIEFETHTFLREGRSFVPLSFVSEVAGYTTQFNEEMATVVISSEPQILEDIIDLLTLMAAGQFQEIVTGYFNEEMKAAISAEEISQIWETVTGSSGDEEWALHLITAYQEASFDIAVVDVRGATTGFHVTVAFDEERLVAGLHISGLYIIDTLALPEGIIEEEVIVGEGTAYELRGTLTLPLEATDPLTAVVLVQGSGPSDRDESAGAYKPFRDIAWGLAEQGIASLRYDKRTYVYAEQLAAQDQTAFTVNEETVEDAILAADLLREDSRIDATQIYLIGHSQGGMLAPRIDAEGGDFAGIVMLAGTPRTLWELIYDQNMALLATIALEPAELEATKAYLEAEVQKAQALQGMTAEEAMLLTIFEMPAYYFYEMDSYSAGDIAAQLEKPILILQGEDDFQVYAEVDFARWEELLGHKDNVTTILYPGLNHFFIAYEGEGKGTLAEYQVLNYVDEGVIADIAAWLNEHSK